ncbi:NUDIX hydrolase [Pseudomonas typographi]|uniref:Phosphatase NudJ n=1 Tax=Pseudomonas typographi TaxID=2715964 RepID=A0ABR7Z5E1_9PSED|nr:NUDIX hydrolase [Pseudomonas typographi]MBD1600724.1 NUDIX hydrolase [Pseudomonas typographi]
MSWQPHITVATLVQDGERFLFVEEHKAGRDVLNQPAGHLEAGETLRQAALRETLEETAWSVALTGVSGIYLYTAPSNGVTYQRVCFSAHPLRHDPHRALDDGILRAVWLTRDQLAAAANRWRSELVLRCLDDYLERGAYPLDVVCD